MVVMSLTITDVLLYNIISKPSWSKTIQFGPFLTEMHIIKQPVCYAVLNCPSLNKLAHYF